MINTSELLKYNGQLHGLIDQKIDSIKKVSTNKEMYLAFVIAKAIKSYSSVMFLCEKRHGEDAFVLCRTLFELLINCLYILNDESDGRLERYFEFDWIIRKQMFDYLKSKPDMIDILEKKEKKYPNIIKEIESECKRVKDEYNYSNTSWSDKSIKDMAEEVGRIDNYYTVYKIQCQLSHSNARSVNEYAVEGESDLIFRIGPSDNLIDETLVASFDFMYHITLEVSKLFKWGIEDELTTLSDEYVKNLNDNQ